MKKIAFVIWTLVILLGAAACSQENQTDNTKASSPPSEGDATNTASPTEGQGGGDNQYGTGQSEGSATVEEGADAVIKALKDKNMETLKSFIHPEKGLLFSPYVHIETEAALVFKRSGLPALNDQKIYTWGLFDGSGEPIKMTFGQYVERFVYDKDFASPEQIGINELKGSGNTLPNLKEVFPEGQYIDYYFSGQQENAGMDWASLIIVLEEYKGRWFAVAAVHNQWTI